MQPNVTSRTTIACSCWCYLKPMLSLVARVRLLLWTNVNTPFECEHTFCLMTKSWTFTRAWALNGTWDFGILNSESELSIITYSHIIKNKNESFTFTLWTVCIPVSIITCQCRISYQAITLCGAFICYNLPVGIVGSNLSTLSHGSRISTRGWH